MTGLPDLASFRLIRSDASSNIGKREFQPWVKHFHQAGRGLVILRLLADDVSDVGAARNFAGPATCGNRRLTIGEQVSQSIRTVLA